MSDTECLSRRGGLSKSRRVDLLQAPGRSGGGVCGAGGPHGSGVRPVDGSVQTVDAEVCLPPPLETTLCLLLALKAEFRVRVFLQVSAHNTTPDPERTVRRRPQRPKSQDPGPAEHDPRPHLPRAQVLQIQGETATSCWGTKTFISCSDRII